MIATTNNNLASVYGKPLLCANSSAFSRGTLKRKEGEKKEGGREGKREGKGERGRGETSLFLGRYFVEKINFFLT